jgi:hypothetical protein
VAITELVVTAALKARIAELEEEVTSLRERWRVEDEKAVGVEQDRKIEDRVIARATDDRSESDIALAHELGDKYGTRLQYPLQFERVRATGQHTFAHELLADLVSDVSDQLYADGRLSRLPALDVSARIKLTADLEDALRLLAFGREAKLGGVLVSVADGKDALQNGLGVAPLFDIFNPRARWMLGQMDAHAPNADLDDYAKLRTWVMGAVNTVGGVALVPQRQATKGFMTLFADSVHSVLKWFQNSNTSYVDYTFNSRPPGGLQVQYHPQHYTSPEVFGTTLSTPAPPTVAVRRNRSSPTTPRRAGPKTAVSQLSWISNAPAVRAGGPGPRTGVGRHCRSAACSSSLLTSSISALSRSISANTSSCAAAGRCRRLALRSSVVIAGIPPIKD